jgi:hypothetical protein
VLFINGQRQYFGQSKRADKQSLSVDKHSLNFIRILKLQVAPASYNFFKMLLLLMRIETQYTNNT